MDLGLGCGYTTYSVDIVDNVDSSPATASPACLKILPVDRKLYDVRSSRPVGLARVMKFARV